MKHMINSNAICPFYKHEDSQMIYCDGVQDGSVIHLAFSNKTNALEYKKTFCRNKCEKCKIYSMLDREEK